MAKDPTKGQQIRDRLADQRQQMLGNFDSWVDETGAQKDCARRGGRCGERRRCQRAQANKNEVRAPTPRRTSRPRRRRRSTRTKVTIGEGDQAVTLAHRLPELQARGLATTALADHARQYAVKLGIAEKGDGELVSPSPPDPTMEAWRKEINAATNQADPVQVRDATILKG
jgi:hypothetical protein